VVGDALHTQRQISIQTGKAGGNYLWTLKGDQPQVLQDLQDWFDAEGGARKLAERCQITENSE